MTGDPIHRLFEGDPRALVDAADASLEALEARIEPAAVACFEPRMRGLQGHFPLLVDAYDRLCTNAGLAMNVFHHRDWHAARPNRWHGAFPLVDHLVGAGRPVDHFVLDAYTEMTREIVAGCAAHSGAKVALFPTARYLTLPGIAGAVRETAGLRAVVVGVMETAPVPDCDDIELVTEAFRGAATLLADIGKDVLLVAESAALADALVGYGFDAGQVQIAPYPAAARFDTPGETLRAGAPARIGALGATRPVHQPERLAAYLLEAGLKNTDWRVRLDPTHAAVPLGMTPDDLEAALRERGVTLMPRQLSQHEYDATLAALDVMLLPYGERYRTIGSGIFLECVCAGVVPLVPARSTMRALYERLGGAAPAIAGSSPADLAAAVDACLSGLPALRTNALAVRQAWLAHEHGPAAWRRRVGALIERACAE